VKIRELSEAVNNGTALPVSIAACATTSSSPSDLSSPHYLFQRTLHLEASPNITHIERPSSHARDWRGPDRTRHRRPGLHTSGQTGAGDTQHRDALRKSVALLTTTNLRMIQRLGRSIVHSIWKTFLQGDVAKSTRLRHLAAQQSHQLPSHRLGPISSPRVKSSDRLELVFNIVS
jgi:hypothetical protein